MMTLRDWASLLLVFAVLVFLAFAWASRDRRRS